MTLAVDWFRVIVQLQRAGLSQRQIAKEIEVSPRTIRNYQQAICEPSYSKGAALLEIHKSVIRST